MAIALSLITTLAHDTAAAVFDTPNGAVVFQSLSARAQTWSFRIWREAPGTWADHPETWRDQTIASESAPHPVELDPCAVVYEPVWRASRGQVINHVTLGYGPTPDGGVQPDVTSSNVASIQRFGMRHYGQQTIIADEASARLRANLAVDVQSWPHWGIEEAEVLLDQLDPATRLKVLGLLCGDRVHLPNLPDPAPDDSPIRVVEGWTHTMTATRSVLTLNLSDPTHSYAGITWSALDPAVRWMDVDPSVIWVDTIVDANIKHV